jgi:hypothetical protein
MAKFTPGPWKVGPERDLERKLVYLTVESLAGNVSCISVYGHKRNGESAGEKYTDSLGTERYKPVISADEARANAHLIAAAPELLDALETIFDITPFATNSKDAEIRMRVRAVIAKAKGEVDHA